ncbi:hypothetical protein MCG98_06620 [Ruminococcus sp. OA3]|uniref:hypothetical protein n=1 Tax=Ruminococcus sp. OA3 TaxID=2914164 RepID=UPI001F056904|nr:hypothetical protein [Ruminococcus sp. OA3]MCH1982236.1 hypothetical protein [Ruminococcus sp. OA3]
MFSKTVFKQTLKSNYKLWLVFTVILCAISAVIISVYDPKAMSGMMDMMGSSPMGDMIGDRAADMTSLLGMLGSSFYGMLVVILPLIFIIITANSLVASQVDKGSMAYTLSTPIKRSKVVATQGLYLVTSILAMILAVTIVGLSMVQAVHGGVFGETNTPDVQAISTTMNISAEELEGDLNLILNDENAIREGAETREIEEDVYVSYLGLRLTDKAYEAAADVLETDTAAVSGDPGLLLGNDEALHAAAQATGMDEEAYRAQLETTLAQQADTKQTEEMQNKLMYGLTAAAEMLDMEVSDLSEDMGLLKKSPQAMAVAVNESGLPEATFVLMVNMQLANDELQLDAGVDFSIKDYLILNVGAFLFLFAISSISFVFSCIFNLSKYSLMFGAGIPVAFFIFQIVAQTSESLSGFKYLSLNSLFDPGAITGGGTYGVQFAVLVAVGVVLYIVGLQWFKKKDLPL